MSPVMSPPSVENDLPLCEHCGEYLANHWRRRPCLGPEQYGPEPLTEHCPFCGADAFVEFGAGWGCLNCLIVGLHEAR